MDYGERGRMRYLWKRGSSLPPDALSVDALSVANFEQIGDHFFAADCSVTLVVTPRLFPLLSISV
jgi:hypothetical protein